MKDLERLGKKMSNVFHNVFDDEGNRTALKEINDELANAARKISGVRADQLANEDLDDKPIVRLYWATLSELTAKMFVYASLEQSYYKELDQ